MIFSLGRDGYGRQGASCPEFRQTNQKPMDCVIQNRVKLWGISTLCGQHIQTKYEENKNKRKTLRQPMGSETNSISDHTVCLRVAR